MAEFQNLLSPSVHKHNSIGSDRRTIAIICPKHGFFKNDHCPECAQGKKGEGPAVHTYDWCRGVWEHIDTKPIYIESKEHLIRECEKRGVMPRAFMKPKSIGAGYEIAKGR